MMVRDCGIDRLCAGRNSAQEKIAPRSRQISLPRSLIIVPTAQDYSLTSLRLDLGTASLITEPLVQA